MTHRNPFENTPEGKKTGHEAFGNDIMHGGYIAPLITFARFGQSLERTGAPGKFTNALRKVGRFITETACGSSDAMIQNAYTTGKREEWAQTQAQADSFEAELKEVEAILSGNDVQARIDFADKGEKKRDIR